MRESRQKFFIFSLLVLITMYAGNAIAEGYVPMSLGGSLSYSYGYAQSRDAASENNSLSFGIDLSAYIWQPWFITNTVGMALGVARSETDDGDSSTSEFLAGRTSFNVFPRSRFPFSLTLSRGDSRADSTFSGIKHTSNEFTSSRLIARQSYIGHRGLFGNLTWSHVETDLQDDKSSSDNVNLNVRKRIPKHTFTGDVYYATSDSDGATTKPENVGASLSHNFVPSTSVNVASAVNYNLSEVSGGSFNSENENVQFSSFFSWRPDYKAVSISGGARMSSTTNSSSVQLTDQEGKDFGVNVGLSYQMTTRVRVSASASANLSDQNGKQTSSATQSGSISYSSDQYILAGFNYGWGGTASVSNAVTEDDTTSSSEQVVSFGANHRASRFWVVGRASSLNLGISQAFAGSRTAEADREPNQTVTHGLNMGLSTRGLRGTTYVSMGLTDSRTFGEVEAEFQQMNWNLSQNVIINRLSMIVGTATFQTSRQTAEGAKTRTVSNVRSNIRYRHGRFLGIYGMYYNSNVTYSRPLTETTSDHERATWENKLDYRIGLLTTSLSVNAAKNAGLDPTYSVYFRATRTF